MNSYISNSISIENHESCISGIKEQLIFYGNGTNTSLKAKIDIGNSPKFHFNQNIESPQNTLTKNLRFPINNNSNTTLRKPGSDISQGDNISISIKQEPNLMNFSKMPTSQMKSFPSNYYLSTKVLSDIKSSSKNQDFNSHFSNSNNGNSHINYNK